MAEKDFKVKNGLVVNDSATFNSVVTVAGNVNVTGTITGTFEGSTTGFDSDFASKTTADLTEGSNLYYTTARADSDAKHAISLTDAGGDGSMTYNSDTGAITYTGPSAAEVRAHFTGGTGVTITDGDVAIGQDVGTTDNVTFAKITGDSAALDNIKFNSRATAPSSTFGTMYYDSDEQKGPSITLRTLENTSPGVTLNVGQEILLYVHNLTGQQINNGEAVYISGTAHGQHPQVSLARANTSATGTATGLATMNIPNGAHGWVTRYGMVRDLNTSAFTAGDVLYLSADSAGQLTNSAVTVDTGYPQHIARVMTVDSTAGMVLVDPLAEHFEYLRIQDRLRIDGSLQADSAALGQIEFGTNWTDSHIGFTEGALWYDPHHKNLNYYTDFDHPIEIGMQVVERVYNETGSTISKGSPLYYSGNRTDTAGQESPTVALANATSSTKYNVQGLAAEDIPNNSYGQIIVAGVIDGFDTSSLNAGENFFAGLTDGAVQNAPPSYPNYPMCLGWVIVSDSNNGKVIINQQNHSVNSFRVQGETHISSNLIVDGNFTVNGTQTIASTENVNIGGNIQYLNAGNTIGEDNTVFVGTGLDDAFYAGHYSGDSSTKSFFVKIDGTGTPDTFEWGFDSSVGTEATGVAITGAEQTLAAGISIDFGATTGHTIGDKWTGTAAALNTDTGLFSNKNEGDAGNGYTHIGLYWDATEDEWTFVGQYDSEPSAPINRSAPTFQYGDVRGKDFYGTTFNGALSGNATTATRLQTARDFSLTGDITASAVSFDGTGNLQLTTAYNPGSIVNADINAAAAIADTKLATISTAGKVQNSATSATDANTGSAIVARDASGDFSAGIITADFNRSANTTVEAGTYGSASLVPVLTVDSSGFIDSIGNVSVAGVASLAFDSATHTFTINTADGGSFSEIVQTKMPGSSGSFGSASLVPVVTVNQYGLVDSISTVSVAGVSTFDFDSATGKITIGTADGGTFQQVITLDPYTTSNLTEGTNQYFTNTRARNAISVTDAGGDGSLGYNSGTGEITYTGPSASEVRAHFSGGTGITYNSGTGEITTTDADIVHDNLSGFVADEHVAHTSVSITAGTGLTGGGDISATRTLNVIGSAGITANADNIAIDSAHIRTLFSGGTGITYNSGTGAITTTDADIVHDNLSGFVADEHVAHSSVSITAGAGLTGGGDISATRTLNVIGSAGITVNADNVVIDSAHVRSLFSASGDLSYNSGTGAFSFSETYSTPAQLMTAIKTVDSNGSGLNADTLDGQQGSYYRIDVYDASGTLLN